MRCAASQLLPVNSLVGSTQRHKITGAKYSRSTTWKDKLRDESIFQKDQLTLLPFHASKTLGATRSPVPSPAASNPRGGGTPYILPLLLLPKKKLIQANYTRSPPPYSSVPSSKIDEQNRKRWI
jgi:hypothetical protein